LNGWNVDIQRCAAAACVCVLAGCSHAITQSTPYYENGPHQTQPPNGNLPEGTGVWVVGREGSYYKVMADNGVVAYVWDRALTPMHEWLMRPKSAPRESGKEWGDKKSPPLYIEHRAEDSGEITAPSE
jgi:hypothetical protein